MSGCQGSMLSVLTVAPCLQMYVKTVAACLWNTTSFRESLLQNSGMKKFITSKTFTPATIACLRHTKKLFLFVLPWVKSVSVVISLKASQRQMLTEEGCLQKIFSLSNYITFHHGADRLHHFHGITHITPNICHWYICWGWKARRWWWRLIWVKEDWMLDGSSKNIKDL